MKKYLIESGIPSDKIYVLELFDYLCNTKRNKISEQFNKNNISIIYTGNIDKAPFIDQIISDQMNFTLNVYGLCNKEINNKKIIYKGKFSPDELPDNLEGDLGLVWDGNFDESDENYGFKNYTRYNNPHKLSCYIAAEKPVIVWEKSAVSQFVKEYNIGYTIRNIYDINNIDLSDYDEKKRNVEELSKKVKDGYFTKKIMDEIIKKCNVEEENHVN